MDANQIIHEAMGLCWHDDGMGYLEKGALRGCGKCHKLQWDEHNPDYTAPFHFESVMDWIRIDEERVKDLEMFFDFNQWLSMSRTAKIIKIAVIIKAGLLKQQKEINQ